MSESNAKGTLGWLLAASGEMADRVRATEWSRTLLGSAEGWSPALKTTTSMMLANRFPMLLWWGPESVCIYNDAYVPVLGAKHPEALGLPVKQVWSEIYDVLEPLIVTPLTGGPSTWSEDLLLEIRRHDFLEETHWTIAYSPVPDDTAPNGIGGVLATVHEVTAQILSARRNALLRDLGARGTEGRSVDDVCISAAAAMARYPHDLPFASIYVLDPEGHSAHLAAAAGIEAGHPACPRVIRLQGDAETWPISSALSSRTPVEVDLPPERFGELPRGAWSDPPARALVLPLTSAIDNQPAGVLVVGLSPRLRLDAPYRDFLELVTSQMSSALASAQAYEFERRRAEALAELDRAKTAFFSNVSHEFRTPLTLILGPVADGLEDTSDPLSPGQRQRQEAVHKNSIRLLKLVNSLLDFSRIEAGRIQACYAPTDLAALTAGTASAFRSLVERSGLELSIDCPPLPEPVFVDREMWEKIVLNLVSNAYKFTLAGEITVKLESDAKVARLSVTDTGTGIDAQHLPHVFERFYRVEGAEGRTHEGTGIGLAFVRELARLHGGSATLASQKSFGTTVTITVPLGSAHLRQDQVKSAELRFPTGAVARSFVEEAGGWETGETPSGAPAEPALGEAASDEAAVPAHILVADDNLDMREYLQRILGSLGTVELVKNGNEALAAIRRRLPDLVLSDVMMPDLDGMALVRALRSDPETETLPIVLLSARAGEEARVDGANVGADDYIVKPFSARELVARVRSQLELARLRRDNARALRESEAKSLLHTNALLAEEDRRKNEFLAMLSHELRNPLSPIVTSLSLMKRVPAGDPRAQRAMLIIERQIGQLSNLVNDLLDVTRITQNKLQLQLQRVDLNETVQQAVEDNRSFFERAGVRIEIVREERPVHVAADRTRLGQIVGNLLHNAAKFTPRGGVTRAIVAVDGKEALVSVVDSGVGMSPLSLERLFQPFVQAEQTLARSEGGLGLGLALVKRLAELHGGTVSAHSDGIGRGSDLTVRLPLDAGDAMAPTDSQAPPPASSLRVLVIEDNVDSAEVLGEVLRDSGHEVAISCDGVAGLEQARRFHPDVVLCDIGLPGMDGYEVARAFRADEALRDTFLVALTGYALPDDVRRATEAGFQRHLAKPPGVDKLEQMMAAVGASRH